MEKYALGGGFSLPADGTHVVINTITLSPGTYRISAGAYADPTNTYTISGYDAIVFPVFVPHFNLTSRYGGENYDILDLGIFLITSPGAIQLQAYNEHGVASGGSTSMLVASPVKL